MGCSLFKPTGQAKAIQITEDDINEITFPGGHFVVFGMVLTAQVGDYLVSPVPM